MMPKPVTQPSQRRQVSSGPPPGHQYVRPLRPQPSHAPPYRLTLGHRRNRSHGGIGASLVEHTLGQVPRPDPIPVRSSQDRPGSGIRPRRRQQSISALAHRAPIMPLSRTNIRFSDSLQ
jgi:hypothetical protein